MPYEIILDVIYILIAVSLVLGERQLAMRGWEMPGFSLSGISDPLAALVVGLFAITLFGLVLYIGAAPPILIHDFAKHGWHFVPGPADLVHVGPVGNLAQIVGAGAAAWMFFRAIVLILAIALVFGILSNHYHF